MKFKITTIGLLAATFLTCVLTSYTLVKEAEKQTKLQLICTEINYFKFEEEKRIGSYSPDEYSKIAKEWGAILTDIEIDTQKLQ